MKATSIVVSILLLASTPAWALPKMGQYLVKRSCNGVLDGHGSLESGSSFSEEQLKTWSNSIWNELRAKNIDAEGIGITTNKDGQQIIVVYVKETHLERVIDAIDHYDVPIAYETIDGFSSL